MSLPNFRFRSPTSRPRGVFENKKPRPIGRSPLFAPKVVPHRRGVPRILALFSPRQVSPRIVLVERPPAFSRRSRRSGHRRRADRAVVRAASSEGDGEGPAPPPRGRISSRAADSSGRQSDPPFSQGGDGQRDSATRLLREACYGW
jgi:hypothetical protein